MRQESRPITAIAKAADLTEDASRLKVLHAIHAHFPEAIGGIQMYLRDLMRCQMESGMDLRLLTGSMQSWDEVGGEPVRVDSVDGLKLHRADHFFDHFAKSYHPVIEAKVRSYLENERPDLLHVHHWLMLTSNLVEIAQELSIPSVITLHDACTTCPRGYRVHRRGHACDLPLSIDNCADCVPRYGHESETEVATSIELFHEQLQAERAAAGAVLVATEATAELVARTTGFPRTSMTVLPLGYHRRFADKTPEPRARASGEPMRFGWWGVPEQHKGVGVLVSACKILATGGDSFELHVFGAIDSAFGKRLQRDADGLPVTFHGEFDAADLAGAELHIGVFPSLGFETYALTIDECFELQMPCIVSDVGALPTRAGRAGVVVPPGDAEALAAAMTKLIANSQECDELRRGVPALSATPEQHARELRTIYDRVVSVGAKPRTATRASERWRQFIAGQKESILRSDHPETGPR
jgi:glycogen(starch) synthase